MEPAHLLLTAGACGGRNPHPCHGLGTFSFSLPGKLAPAPALHEDQLPVSLEGAGLLLGLEMVNEKWGQEWL